MSSSTYGPRKRWGDSYVRFSAVTRKSALSAKGVQASMWLCSVSRPSPLMGNGWSLRFASASPLVGRTDDFWAFRSGGKTDPPFDEGPRTFIGFGLRRLQGNMNPKQRVDMKKGCWKKVKKDCWPESTPDRSPFVGQKVKVRACTVHRSRKYS